MNDLGWTANGIERARACGGVELERYRRPGFTGGVSVRRNYGDSGPGSGLPLDAYPGEGEDDRARAKRRRGGR